MSIYKIDQAILSLVDPETGEITDWAAFEELQMERDAKVEAVALWYKNLVAEAKAIKEEEQALAERRKKLESMAETRKKYLEYALNGQKFQTARCAVTFRKSTRVELEDPDKVIKWAEANGHKECVSYKAPEANKTEIGKLLKGQVNVPGAVLVEGRSLTVK